MTNDNNLMHDDSLNKSLGIISPYSSMSKQELMNDVSGVLSQRPDTVIWESGGSSFAESPEYMRYLDKLILDTFKSRNIKAEVTVGREQLIRFFQSMMLISEDIQTLVANNKIMIEQHSSDNKLLIQDSMNMASIINQLKIQVDITKQIFEVFKQGL